MTLQQAFEDVIRLKLDAEDLLFRAGLELNEPIVGSFEFRIEPDELNAYEFHIAYFFNGEWLGCISDFLNNKTLFFTVAEIASKTKKSSKYSANTAMPVTREWKL